jgi:transposase
MIFPSNRVRIMVATKPVDFRKGHDGLAALVKNELHKDPFTGAVFVFRSRKADRLKLIYWMVPAPRWPTSGWKSTASPGLASRTA